METNYLSRDTYGMYKNVGPGPGAALMGATEIASGKIKYWRDYYDNLRLRAQMS